MWGCKARDSAVLGGLVQARDGGEAIPPVVARIFFGRQHLTFDKGGKCGGAKQGIVQKISLMVGRGSNHHHSWLGLTVQQNLTPFFEGGHGCPKLNAQSFARMRNQQSVH